MEQEDLGCWENKIEGDEPTLQRLCLSKMGTDYPGGVSHFSLIPRVKNGISQLSIMIDSNIWDNIGPRR